MQVDDGVGSDGTKPPLASRDAELLLSYLTVPYLRIPLLLQFFADQQRLNALGSTRMQEVLESSIFEPGAWQETPQRKVPTEVPARSPEERAQVLATPLGLLLNELLLSPQLVLDPLQRLLEMALDSKRTTLSSQTHVTCPRLSPAPGRADSCVSPRPLPNTTCCSGHGGGGRRLGSDHLLRAATCGTHRIVRLLHKRPPRLLGGGDGGGHAS